MVTGTIRSAVHLQVLDNKWQQKKNSINEKKPLSEMTQEERMLSHFQEMAEKERESNKHADTYNKLKSGGKLTSEEIAYLEEHDPEALRKYREDQAEKAAYERELKKCRTKDEVERVKMNKLGNFSAKAKQITNDPYIPLDKKVELMNQLNNKLCLIDEAHQKFVKSRQYQDMPTDAELQERSAEEVPENQEPLKESIATDTDETEDGMRNAVAEREENDRTSEPDMGTEGLSFSKLSSEIREFSKLVQSGKSKVDVSI